MNFNPEPEGELWQYCYVRQSGCALFYSSSRVSILCTCILYTALQNCSSSGSLYSQNLQFMLVMKRNDSYLQ